MTDLSKINLNGWRPNLPDDRDYLYRDISPKLRILPKVVYLNTVPVKDQGELGSCVFNGICTQMEMVELYDQVRILDFSRLELYYKYRQLDGSINEDSGAYPRTALEVARKYGVCMESLWPYDISKFTVKPPDSCFTEAMNHQVLKYYACKDIADIMNRLAQGRSVGFGFTVFTSFMNDQTAETGIWPGRQSGDRSEGGHYAVIVGYDQHMKVGLETGAVLVQNSWGTEWGCQPHAYNSRGFFWMSFYWLMKVGGDFQTIQTIEEV